MQTVYVEKAVEGHPRVRRIIDRFSQAVDVIRCERYGEVFNPKSQNFRLQKQKPALILAEKKGRRVLPAPQGFGIGGERNYYFSHMLNCLYDCRYCFLQGMYQSANYVVFVNFEDFKDEIVQITEQAEGDAVYFFSGYDCDSLAFEPVTHFLEEFLSFFADHPKAILELRTKSTNVKALLKQPVFDNCVVGFSFTPDIISQAVEHKVPAVKKRIEAMRKVAEKGWKVGLRFDPLIYATNYQQLYAELVHDVFAFIPAAAIHSVSVGPLRFPAKMYQKLVKLYPQDKLLAQPLLRRKSYFSYKKEVEDQMKRFVTDCITQYVKEPLLFECQL